MPGPGRKRGRAFRASALGWPAVITRMSELFVRTLRDDPADAEVPSHRWLVRAGYIRRAAPGIYSWLPLGWRVLRNVERIVREEMDAIGSQEVHFPALLPREPYEASGRWKTYGDGIFRLKDRKGGDYLLGPTHEEMFTLLVKDLYSSYKDLPLSLYQIQTKYRDEARPRAGILRGREFVMKDSYSFDVDDEGCRSPTTRTATPTSRSSTGSASSTRSCTPRPGRWAARPARSSSPSPRTGRTPSSGPTAGTRPTSRRSACIAPEPVPYDDAPAAHVEDTPETPTIQTLVDHANAQVPRADRPWTAADTLKNVLLMIRKLDGAREPLAIAVPGDREVDLKRLAAQLEPDEAEPFTDEDFAAHPSLVKGYIGPGVLGADNESGIRYLADPRVVTGTRWVTGADDPGPARLRPGLRSRLHPGRGDRRRGGAGGRSGAGRLRSAATGAGHRDGSHLPARALVRRGARAEGARRDRQAGHGDHGLVRGRACPGRWPPSRRTPRTRRGCAGRGSWRRSTCTSSRPARGRRSRPRPPTWPPSSTRPGSRCWSTTARSPRA